MLKIVIFVSVVWVYSMYKTYQYAYLRGYGQGRMDKTLGR